MPRSHWPRATTPRKGSPASPSPSCSSATSGNAARPSAPERSPNRLRRLCDELGRQHPAFATAHFSPQDFRRLLATDLVNSGLPIHIGAALLGHLNIETTRGYAACAVRPATLSEFDLAFVEVLFELDPFVVGGGTARADSPRPTSRRLLERIMTPTPAGPSPTSIRRRPVPPRSGRSCICWLPPSRRAGTCPR